MVIRNEGQALCIAVEMEKRAIRIYERALQLVQEESVRAGLEEILREERGHLCRFNEMRSAYPLSEGEEAHLASSMASEALYPGGVMELHREKALASLEELYRYAASSEAQAVETYLSFAKKCASPAVQEAFLSIAREESEHLSDMENRG